jgi:hypothetical protein
MIKYVNMSHALILNVIIIIKILRDEGGMIVLRQVRYIIYLYIQTIMALKKKKKMNNSNYKNNLSEC